MDYTFCQTHIYILYKQGCSVAAWSATRGDRASLFPRKHQAHAKDRWPLRPTVLCSPLSAPQVRSVRAIPALLGPVLFSQHFFLAEAEIADALGNQLVQLLRRSDGVLGGIGIATGTKGLGRDEA